MDKYDAAIAYLTAYPSEIARAWAMVSTHPAGCLFAFCGRTGSADDKDEEGRRFCGCLTQVRNGDHAYTPALTAAIRADARIPGNDQQITIESLPVFAEWQRRLDREIRGVS